MVSVKPTDRSAADAPPAGDEPRISRIPEATPVSRLLRFALGAALLAWMLPRVVTASPANQAWVWGAVVGLTLFYVVVHWAIRRYLSWLHPWLGACVAVVPVLFLSAWGPNTSAAAVLYVGLSLVLLSVRGEPGCECLAVPAMLSRRPTHLACLLFSPLDWIEQKLLGAARQRP